MLNEYKALPTNSITHPSGTLRLTAPLFLAKECLHKVLPDFLNTFPDIKVELTAVDRLVDLVDEGFDLALRVGELPDSTLIARHLGKLQLGIFASPDYLDSEGKPNKAIDLKNHNCIVDTAANFNNRWPIKSNNKRQHVNVSGQHQGK